MTEFKDHFSEQSQGYAKYRPTYPDSLFDWLALLVQSRDIAWDVGTGSGQAALGIARHFRQVMATDPAEAQLRNAVKHPRILYKVMSAEQADFPDASIDLITVAQALHWFDFDRFYREVKRVGKPGGAIVVWTYGLTRVSAEVDEVVQRYYEDIVGPYWPPERFHVDTHYRTIPFPFPELEPPAFSMEAEWTAEEFIGYLGTWSASQRYAKARGTNPLDGILKPLQQAWGVAHERRTVTWPLYIRAGRISRLNLSSFPAS